MMTSFLHIFSESITFFVIFPLILISGLYLSISLGFVQVVKIKEGFSALLKADKGAKGDISHFQAISTVLAGNLGTGNISGMAIALATGGAGAIFWMWTMAFFGAVLKYSGCLLGVKFRHKNEKGEYVGGPMYYLREGLGMKRAAAFFCIFAIITACTTGNLVQVNSVSLPLEQFGISPLFFGLISACLVAYVILGGGHRFAVIASTVVPVMATVYLTFALFILATRIDQVLPAFKMMLTSAFDLTALFGGALGYGMVRAISAGFERGIFATDAGTGIAPVLQAGARTKSAVVEGIVAMVAPFVVVVICTITGLVLIVTGAWQEPHLKSTMKCTWAFEEGVGHAMGGFVVLLSLLLFAFTTILAWAYCAEKAMEYLCPRWIKYFRYFYIALVPIGALVHVDIVWTLADISMAGMLIINLIGVIGLSNIIIAESTKYFSPVKG